MSAHDHDAYLMALPLVKLVLLVLPLIHLLFHLDGMYRLWQPSSKVSCLWGRLFEGQLEITLLWLLW